MKREIPIRMASPPLDLLVAGAGIAGLHVVTSYLTHKGSPPQAASAASIHKGSTQKVLLVERNPYLGGRIYTHRPYIPGKGTYQWEAGAGRIPTSHKRIIGLIKRYGLTFQHWISPSNLVDPFPDLIPIYLEPLQALPAPVLAQHTLAELLHQIHGPKANEFIRLFPYWAEFHTLRADVALDTFLHGPLGPGTSKAGHGPAVNKGWGGCAEGLGELPRRMGEDIQARGGEIRLGTSVVAIRPIKDGFDVLLESNGKRYQVEAKRVVLALDVSSLKHIKGPTQHLPVLRYLKQEPLLRTYAVFPVKGGKSWFSGMAKEVLPYSPIRFFIPMQPERGLAMISYTEGRDATHWMNMPEKKRTTEMMKALRALYPTKEIPDPIAIKFHGWRTGCTYWISRPSAGDPLVVPARGAAATAKEHWISRPSAGDPSRVSRPKAGDGYDAEEESNKSVEPLSGLYLCSESFALQQSWMESGLVQAEKVLAKLLP